MSLGDRCVFRLMRMGHFRVPVTLSQLPFMGVSCLLTWSHWPLTITESPYTLSIFAQGNLLGVTSFFRQHNRQETACLLTTRRIT